MGIGQAAKLLGITVKTLQRWERDCSGAGVLNKMATR
jgi:DNA-binding transcriptional regulator YiaG